MSERERASGESEVKISANIAPFLFSPESYHFFIGSRNRQVAIGIKEIQDFTLFDSIANAVGREFNPKTREKMVIDGLFGLPIELPSMRKFLINLSVKKKREFMLKTANTIKNVYELVDPSIDLPEVSEWFSAYTFSGLIENDGSFILNTFGNCACLSRSLDPIVISYEDYRSDLKNIDLPLAYVMHNDDSPAQRLSLYAGAGTLAWLAKHGLGDVNDM